MSCVTAGVLVALSFFCPVALPLLLIYGFARLVAALFRNIGLLIVFAILIGLSIINSGFAALTVVVILALILYRVDVIRTHWSVMKWGLQIYAGAGVLAVASLLWLSLAVELVRGPFFFLVATAAVICIPSAIAAGALAASWVDRSLREFYKNGYTANQVHELATTAPMVLILLLLSVVGIGFDLLVDTGVDAGVGSDAPPADPPPNPQGSAAVDVAAEPPGTIEIAPYARTHPDGILENNLSYEGIRPVGTPEAPGTHIVEAHVRTLPDGIVENNLSYRGPVDAVEPGPPSVLDLPPESGPLNQVPAGELAASSGASAARAPSSLERLCHGCRRFVSAAQCPHCGAT